MTRPDFSFEDSHQGITCGIDEVGRGPLAGPVVAAAVILNRGTLPSDMLDQINDSKKLTHARREYLFHKLHEHADIAIAQCCASEIDSINILQASLLAMQKACTGLKTRPTLALIDGNKTPKNMPCATQTIIKGDARSFSIAAASIIAKHFRDELMTKYAKEYPYYGWETNAGYGTATHLKALAEHGVTPLHRQSFAPVREILYQSSNDGRADDLPPKGYFAAS